MVEVEVVWVNFEVMVLKLEVVWEKVVFLVILVLLTEYQFTENPSLSLPCQLADEK